MLSARPSMSLGSVANPAPDSLIIVFEIPLIEPTIGYAECHI